jgi:hypothetical protein
LADSASQSESLFDFRPPFQLIQGGKGRTGLFISAFLLWSGHRRTALDALELFTFRRTENYSAEVNTQRHCGINMDPSQLNKIWFPQEVQDEIDHFSRDVFSSICHFLNSDLIANCHSDWT